MKPKDYLRSIGVETGGRGRMPAAHVALVKEAVAKGIAIDGYAVAKPTAAKASDKPSDKPATVNKVATAGVKTIADIGDPRYDEREWEAFRILPNGKEQEVGMRTVCLTCGASFTYHVCNSPQTWDDKNKRVEVKFRGRRAK